MEQASETNRANFFSRWWWKLLLIGSASLLALLTLLWLFLPAIVTGVTNFVLPKLLQVEASIGQVELDLDQGVVVLRTVKIAQPEGFGEGYILELDRLQVQADLAELQQSELLEIRTIELEGLQVQLIRTADGLLNLMQLLNPLLADDLASSSATDSTKASGRVISGLRLDRLAIKDVALNYTDRSTTPEPAEFALGDLQVALEQIQIQWADKIAIRLQEGFVVLDDISATQVGTTSEERLLSLTHLRVVADQQLLVDDQIYLQTVEARDGRARLVRDADGEMNIGQLFSTATEPERVEVVETAEQESAFGVQIGELLLADFGCSYTDADLENYQYKLQDAGLQFSNLRVFNPADGPVSSTRLDFAISQGDAPPALFTLLADLGTIEAAVPKLNARLQLTGLLLDSLGPLVAPGDKEKIGANGLDVRLQVALDQTGIKLRGKTFTDSGPTYPMVVSGALDNPKMDLGPIFVSVAGRMVSMVDDLTLGAGGTVVDLSKGAVSGAGKLGEGVVDTAGGIFSGFLKTVKSAFSGNITGTADALTGTVVGTVKGVGETVAGAGDEVGGHTWEAIRFKSRTKQEQAWVDAISERHAKAVSDGEKGLSEMPYPPVIH